MKPLFLILKKQYFDQILSGQKKQEFRLMTDFWKNRIENKNYSSIVFQLGYSKANRFEIEYLGYEVKKIKLEFFGENEVSVFVLNLGKINANIHS